MKTRSLLTLICGALLVACLPLVAAAQKTKKKPTIEALIIQISAQLDQMEQDHRNQLKAIEELFEKVTQSEQDNLQRKLGAARVAAMQREAIVTSDDMIDSPRENTRAGAFAAYLRRSSTRDQELFDAYVKNVADTRFSRERQIAKIKSQITLIQSIRRDLEKLKKFPTDGERARFFLDSAQVALDAIATAQEKAASQ